MLGDQARSEDVASFPTHSTLARRARQAQQTQAQTDPPRPLLGEYALGSLACADVAGDRGNARDTPALVADCGHGHRDVHRAAVGTTVGGVKSFGVLSAT